MAEAVGTGPSAGPGIDEDLQVRIEGALRLQIAEMCRRFCIVEPAE
jgi:hypothetical protein